GPDGTPAPAAATVRWPEGVQYLLHVERDEKVFNDLKSALPLRKSDRLRVVCDLPAGGGAAGVLAGAGRRPSRRVAPTTLAPARPWYRLRYPAEGVVPLNDRPGTEMVLVCANRSTKPRREDVLKHLDASPWPQLPPRALGVLTRDRADVEGERAPG